MFPLSEFRRCRRLSSEDNLNMKYVWVVERTDRPLRELTLLKGKKAHLVLLQNGTIETSDGCRYRTGFWTGGFRHFSSIAFEVDGMDGDEAIQKYVRTPDYVYRRYRGVERIDAVPNNLSIFHMSLLTSSAHSITVRLKVSHAFMWPSDITGRDYKYARRGKQIIIKSSIGETAVVLPSASTRCKFEDGILEIYIDGTSQLIAGSNLPRRPAISKIAERRVVWDGGCVLDTPDFRFNKAFFWAKHALKEFYSETEAGNGFLAGFPEFSWFFGRDGEWMSIAASMCNLGHLGREHLDMLFSHSKDGRIPHEIPLLPDVFLSQSGSFSTGFMSIDSTPLWIIAHYINSAWLGIECDRTAVQKCIDFIRSCDRDGDGLIENSFKDGLIGWPESWADRRDGACIDANAWWLAALHIHSRLKGDYEEFRRNFDRFVQTFFRDDGSVFDSVRGGEGRVIKNACEIVPAIYWRNEKLAELVSYLSTQDIQTPWGMRSMSTHSPLYDRGYHTGQVWPLMTGWYCLAAYRNGRYRDAFRALQTFVELTFCSHEPGRINEVYASEHMLPVGQFAQGWSSSLFIQSVVEGLFGIDVLSSPEDAIYSAEPHLPEEWDHMSLKKIQYRGGLFDIRVDKNGLSVRRR
jgi:glycogen debranching enzyme